MHLDRGYDFPGTPARLAVLGLVGEISRRGASVPIAATGRWVIERTHALLNAFKKLVWGTERRAVVIHFCGSSAPRASPDQPAYWRKRIRGGMSAVPLARASFCQIAIIELLTGSLYDRTLLNRACHERIARQLKSNLGQATPERGSSGIRVRSRQIPEWGVEETPCRRCERQCCARSQS